MNWVRPIACAVVCVWLGYLSGQSTIEEINTWYRGLAKPSFNPPNWIFAPVWSLLYLMMGVAAGLVWNQGLSRPAVKGALILFAAQLILNLAWSPIFFGQHMLMGGLVVIIALWVGIVICMVRFLKLNKFAGIMFVPYLLWVSFATLLNYSLWQLNS